MEIFNLPLDILPGGKLPDEGLVIYPYTAQMGRFKGKSILHTHAISLVLRGTKTMHFSEETIDVNANSFHFLSAGKCLASMDIPRNESFSSILIFFTNACLERFFLKYHAQAARARQKVDVEARPYISLQKDDFIRGYMDTLQILLARSPALSPEMQLLKFEELMLYLLQQYPGKLLAFQLAAQDKSAAFEIRQVVETNIGNNLSLEELAFLCNCSLSTFKRKFRSLYGTSPSRWLMLRRMEIAANLLKTEEVRPGEIYHRVGYETHSSFSQSFKSVYGQSPRDFQAAHLTR